MLLKIVITTALIATVYAKCKPSQCPDYPRLYRELGCTPKHTNGAKCPNSFMCPDFTSFNKSQCHYKGMSYNSGQELQRGEEPICQTNCMCSSDDITNRTYFQCAYFDCFAPQIPTGCVVQNQLNQCCPSVKFVCGLAAKRLPKCTLEGKTYVKGNIMSPSNACYNCLCDEHFNNATAYEYNKNCQLIKCGIEVNDIINLENGCAPIFSDGENSCCPIDFRCPAATDYILPRHRGGSSGVCKFGKLTLHQSDVLNSIDDLCTKCSCTNPPMVQCIRKSDC